MNTKKHLMTPHALALCAVTTGFLPRVRPDAGCRRDADGHRALGHDGGRERHGRDGEREAGRHHGARDVRGQRHLVERQDRRRVGGRRGGAADPERRPDHLQGRPWPST